MLNNFEMCVLIVCASRYGSTRELAEMIAGSLRSEGVETFLADAEDMPDVTGYGVVVLGSGIYAHRFLPEMESFIEERRTELSGVKLAMFGAAMRTETVHKNGRSFGGELILDKYGLNPQLKAMLHGRMDFSALNEKDRAGLERFYDSIGLSEEQKAERRKLRDMISPEEAASFAEYVIQLLD